MPATRMLCTGMDKVKFVYNNIVITEKEQRRAARKCRIN